MHLLIMIRFWKVSERINMAPDTMDRVLGIVQRGARSSLKLLEGIITCFKSIKSDLIGVIESWDELVVFPFVVVNHIAVSRLYGYYVSSSSVLLPSGILLVAFNVVFSCRKVHLLP